MSTLFLAPSSFHFAHSSKVERTSVMPLVPGPRYSSKVPTAPPKVSRNWPSAGSSGITARREA